MELRGRGRNQLCLVDDIPDGGPGGFQVALRIGGVVITDGDGFSILETTTMNRNVCKIEELCYLPKHTATLRIGDESPA